MVANIILTHRQCLCHTH